VLFNEPKLLKFGKSTGSQKMLRGFSALQRAEIAEILGETICRHTVRQVSVLFNEPKLLKC